jgi:hypothetical protein
MRKIHFYIIGCDKKQHKQKIDLKNTKLEKKTALPTLIIKKKFIIKVINIEKFYHFTVIVIH